MFFGGLYSFSLFSHSFPVYPIGHLLGLFFLGETCNYKVVFLFFFSSLINKKQQRRNKEKEKERANVSLCAWERNIARMISRELMLIRRIKAENSSTISFSLFYLRLSSCWLDFSCIHQHHVRPTANIPLSCSLSCVSLLWVSKF